MALLPKKQRKVLTKIQEGQHLVRYENNGNPYYKFDYETEEIGMGDVSFLVTQGFIELPPMTDTLRLTAKGKKYKIQS